VARGLVSYPAEEVRLVCGAHSSEMPAILGHVGHEEVIHLNNLVLTGE
jgi:glutamate 5-kinase